MQIPKILFASALACWMPAQLICAQDTNSCPWVPATKLEAFETNISRIIIKGTTEMGAVSAANGMVSIKCREITDPYAGVKEHGIVVEISRPDQGRDLMLIDYDELASLLNAIDYFSKLDVSISSLNSFDAAYTTKGGFRIAALGNRRTGVVQFGVRDIRTGWAPTPLSRQEMTQLWGLIDQARKQLDALRG